MILHGLWTDCLSVSCVPGWASGPPTGGIMPLSFHGPHHSWSSMPGLGSYSEHHFNLTQTSFLSAWWQCVKESNENLSDIMKFSAWQFKLHLEKWHSPEYQHFLYLFPWAQFPLGVTQRRPGDTWITLKDPRFEDPKSFIMNSKQTYSLLWREMSLIFQGYLLYKWPWANNPEQRQSQLCLRHAETWETGENCSPTVRRREVNSGKGNIEYHNIKDNLCKFLKGVGRARIKYSEGNVGLGKERDCLYLE